MHINSDCIKQEVENDELDKGQNMPDIDLYLNPNKEKYLQRVIEGKKTKFRNYFRSIDMKRLYPNLFQILWSAFLPCYVSNGHLYSLIKECKVGNKKIDCSKIFQKVPSDSGMCCAMNIEDTFKNSDFSELVRSMQNKDESIKTDMIKSKPGKENGIRISVDLHSSYVSHGSNFADYQAFKVFVGDPHEFPNMRSYGLTIEPGHEHFLSISNTILTANKEVKKIKPKDRNCYFKEESKLEYYKHYTFSNCQQECSMKKAHEKLECTPWYLPRRGNSTLCDPWAARDFLKLMTSVNNAEECGHCLPDCQKNSFFVSSSAVKFG